MAIDKNSSQKENIPSIVHPPIPHVIMFIIIKIVIWSILFLWGHVHIFIIVLHSLQQKVSMYAKWFH